MISVVTATAGILHGVMPRGWIKSWFHRNPVIALSVALGVTGVCMPLVVIPIRRYMGYPTNHYNPDHPLCVYPQYVEEYLPLSHPQYLRTERLANAKRMMNSPDPEVSSD
jgi:hypothetical protein